MFEISWSEIFIVAVVAIVVVGPKELPAMLRTFGRALGQLRRMARDFQSTFNEALREAEKQANTEGMKKEFDSIRSMDPTKDLRKNLDDVKKQMSARVTDAPAATPANATPSAGPAESTAPASGVGSVASVAVGSSPAAANDPTEQTISGPSVQTVVGSADPMTTSALSSNVDAAGGPETAAPSPPLSFSPPSSPAVASASFSGVGATAAPNGPVVGPAMARVMPAVAVPPATPTPPATPVVPAPASREQSPTMLHPAAAPAVASSSPAGPSEPAPTITSVGAPAEPHELPRAAGERR